MGQYCNLNLRRILNIRNIIQLWSIIIIFVINITSAFMNHCILITLVTSILHTNKIYGARELIFDSVPLIIINVELLSPCLFVCV